MNMHSRNLIVCAAVALMSTNLSALAQEHPIHKCVEWKKLNLKPQQAQQINQLESEWHTKYATTAPKIADLQKKLERLLSNAKSDPLEIMSTQQTIARLKDQLRNEATTNYLRKRALLNETQQHQLEGMLQQMVVERQRGSAASQAEQTPGIVNIVNKIKWAIEPH